MLVEVSGVSVVSSGAITMLRLVVTVTLHITRSDLPRLTPSIVRVKLASVELREKSFECVSSRLLTLIISLLHSSSFKQYVMFRL